MSWNIDVVSKDKEAIRNAINYEVNMPTQLQALLCAHVDARDPPVEASYGTFGIHLKSSGHADKNSCYGDFRVELTRMV